MRLILSESFIYSKGDAELHLLIDHEKQAFMLSEPNRADGVRVLSGKISNMTYALDTAELILEAVKFATTRIQFVKDARRLTKELEDIPNEIAKSMEARSCSCITSVENTHTPVPTLLANPRFTKQEFSDDNQ